MHIHEVLVNKGILTSWQFQNSPIYHISFLLCIKCDFLFLEN